MEDSGGDVSQQFGFLPINQSNSPPESRHRRAYLSCERCRKRKSRCEPLPQQPQVCKRCAADSHPCEFRASRSVKRKASKQVGGIEPETRAGHSWSEHQEAGQLQDPMSPIDQSPEVSQSAGAAAEGFGSGEILTPNSSVALDARTRLVSTHIHNTSDALDLLTFAATGSQEHNNHSTAHVNESQATPGINTSIPNAANDAKKITAAWNGFVLIRRGVVSQQEVVEYLDFFFECLWPLKPVIPSYYRNKANYTLLALEEPLLLTCIVTLASRYFNLSGPHGEIRSERIHWRSWLLLQRFLQSVMWGSNTTRSIGAIASMLLLIDWHVKAINNPMDFTEGDGEAINFVDDPETSFKTSPNDADSLTGHRRYGMTSLMEKLNIVSPAYRSNKMSWILLSNAIALAHEGCCFEYEAPSNTTTMSEAETIRQEWSRLVCVFIYLTDEGLATRLGLEPLLPEKSRQVVRDRYSTTFADSLQDSMLWEGYFELFVEARKGREFLHSLKKTGASLSNQNLVPNLEHLGRALNRWKRQYHHRHNANTFLSACLDLEFHYITMYCFAPAAQALQSNSASSTHENAAALSNFAEQAAQASNALLSVVVEILEPARLITYLPVRYWLFIVAASLHLLKAILAKNQHVSGSDPNVHLLRSVIDAIRLGSADDAHMAMRFSKFLGIVLQASLPTSSGQTSAAGGPEIDAQGTGCFQIADDFSGGAFGSALDDGDIWDIPFNLDVVSDPTTWWDSFSGRNGFSRFT